MQTIIEILSSVMFVGGLIITSRQFKPVTQLIIGITMMVLSAVLILVK